MSGIAANFHDNKDLQSILDGIANWDLPSLESFAKGVNEIVAQKKSPNLTKEETDLLKKINAGIPTSALDKYNMLKIKQKADGLSSLEQQEMDNLIDFIETKEAEFLGYLLRLSHLRKVSIENLRKQLGIKTPAPHAW